MSYLCYHTVDTGWQSPLVVSPDAFEQHCRWLAECKEVVSLSEGLARTERVTWRLPAGTAVLTFDDGLAGLYRHAFPILRRHRLPAVVFLVARTLVEEGAAVDWVDTAPDFPLATLTLEQVLEMQEAGIEFASHSWAHHDLTTLSEEECVEDLRASREALSDLLGTRVRTLAYPRGRHDVKVRRAADRAGYAYAFSLPEESEPVCSLAIPRVGIFPANDPSALRVKTSPWYLPVRMSPIFPALRRGWRSLTGAQEPEDTGEGRQTASTGSRHL